MRESQQTERLNIPVSNSLLHNQEHNNTLNLVYENEGIKNKLFLINGFHIVCTLFPY